MTSYVSRSILRYGRAVVAGTALALLATAVAVPAGAQEYRAVTGSGSTWSANMVEQWAADVRQFGIAVNFSATGSSTGRREFNAGTVDFAISEIPYGLTDAQGGYDKPPDRDFAYLPIVAGGTSFMYNLTVAGRPVTNLRLSGDTTAKIFTGVITSWDDPAIAADNPNIALPARAIIPVVRSDGSGTTAQFTSWLSKEHGGVWNDFCNRQRIPFNGSCPFTSNYPSVSGFVSQNGSLGVAGYVATPTAEGAITYVEYSYALNAKRPVAKILNSAGYYVESTEQAVAVGLLGAQINNDRGNRDVYLTQNLDGVYRNPDPRAYPLSSYSYIIIPTAEGGTFKADKGRTLGDFLYYSVCEGQQAAGVLGYSPLPQNLVQAGLEQIRLIPGVDPQAVALDRCNNPTFSSDGTNTLANNAPQPAECDRAGATQCGAGTAGARGTTTPVTAGTPPAAGTTSPPPGTGGAGGGSTAGGGGTTGGTSGTTAPGAGGATATVLDPTTGQQVAATVDPTTGQLVAAAVDPLTGQVLAAPVVDPETGELVAAPLVIDPETGQLVAAPVVDPVTGQVQQSAAGAGTTTVSGVAVSAPGASGSGLQTWLMALAAMSLLVATIGPPALQQRLVRDRG